MKKTFLTALLFLTFAVPADASPSGDDLEAARRIPIQHNGRVKPFDAFARQTMKLVSGRETQAGLSAPAAMIDALADLPRLASLEWIRADHTELKRTLGLSDEKHFFSLAELEPSRDKLESIVRAVKAKRDADQRPTKLEQKAEQLYVKFRTVESLSTGESARVLARGEMEAWESPYGTQGAESARFLTLVKALSENRGADDARAWTRDALGRMGGTSEARIEAEILYYRIAPFRWAAIAYVLGFFLFTFGRRREGLVVAAAGFVLHTAGLSLRVFVLGRPPVSNMYESMVYMNWALILFAAIFASVRRFAPALSAGAAVSALVMIYAGLLPIDSSLDVLVPVLRSNYWLSVHVMTIVSSYGGFGLAMALGHRHLWLAKRGKLPAAAAKESGSLMDRVIQLGTLLIGTGTVLGGVWANESWGRFWGWDPKETWALITFLGYLIAIHLRWAKKLTDFGLALWSVLGFLLVLMTWYGVNFVLGRGLHSYGAGTGGMQWVIYYLILEAAFVAWAVLPLRKR